MKPPAAPPLLVKTAARKAALEAERAEIFPRWRAAIEVASGNVTRAGAAWDPPLRRDQAQRLTRRLDLVDYARALRLAATGRATGRPKTASRKRNGSSN